MASCDVRCEMRSLLSALEAVRRTASLTLTATSFSLRRTIRISVQAGCRAWRSPFRLATPRDWRGGGGGGAAGKKIADAFVQSDADILT